MSNTQQIGIIGHGSATPLTKIVKCVKCPNTFVMPYDFNGTIVCEDCDPFMAQPKEEVKEDWKKLFYSWKQEYINRHAKYPSPELVSAWIESNVITPLQKSLQEKDSEILKLLNVVANRNFEIVEKESQLKGMRQDADMWIQREKSLESENSELKKEIERLKEIEQATKIPFEKG